MLGVDEFALRRGHSYGTLLVDVQTRRPVDVLPERSADSFAAWLAARPGARGDLPGPGRLLFRRRRPRGARWRSRSPTAGICGTTSAKLPSGPSPGTAAACTPATTARPGNRRPEPIAAASRRSSGPARSGRIAERTRQRHAAIHQLLAEGNSVRAIAAELGLARNTVRRFARAADPEQLLVHDGTGRRPSMLDEHDPLPAPAVERRMHRRRPAMAGNPRPRLPGGYSLVRDYLAPLRGTAVAPAPAPPATQGPEGHRLDHEPTPVAWPQTTRPARRHPGPLPRTGRPPGTRARPSPT